MANQPEIYEGKSMVVRFDGSKCIHARHCVLGEPGVFRANVEGPWIDPDGASSESLSAVARACPSGAITYERRDGGPAEAPPHVNVIRLRENGPLAVMADLQIDGQPPAIRATLCRCGASKNKPYCDGSHAPAAFAATGEPASQTANPLQRRDGPLRLKPLPNGPLLVEGNAEICCGTGRTVARTEKTALCRCGGSGNKPFCDGTHGKIGFKTE